MMGTQNTRVSSEIIEIVHNNGYEQVQHLKGTKYNPQSLREASPNGSSSELTKNEQKNMKDTKYAYAIDDPHVSPGGLPALGSHGLPFRQANIMFGHASPVAHLQNGETPSINSCRLIQQQASMVRFSSKIEYQRAND